MCGTRHFRTLGRGPLWLRPTVRTVRSGAQPAGSPGARVALALVMGLGEAPCAGRGERCGPVPAWRPFPGRNGVAVCYE